MQISEAIAVQKLSRYAAEVDQYSTFVIWAFLGCCIPALLSIKITEDLSAMGMLTGLLISLSPLVYGLSRFCWAWVFHRIYLHVALKTFAEHGQATIDYVYLNGGTTRSRNTVVDYSLITNTGYYHSEKQKPGWMMRDPKAGDVMNVHYLPAAPQHHKLRKSGIRLGWEFWFYVLLFTPVFWAVFQMVVFD